MNISLNPWVWIAALLTLAIFSILYRDNPIYRIAEHLFVGIALGYGLAITMHLGIWQLALRPLFVEGRFIVLIPIALGLLYFTRVIPRVSWMIRIPISISLGWAAGVSIPLGFQANILKQVDATLITPQMFKGSPWPGIWAIVLLLGTLATLMYFFFSRKEKSPLKPVSQVGIFFIMVGFGATFGLTVMSRVSLLIGRVQFLLRDWLGIIAR